MPLEVELQAITSMYVKLMDLPVKDLLPALTRDGVITADQKEDLKGMSKDKDRAAFLMDDVIIKSLRVDFLGLFIKFLNVLEESTNPVVKAVGQELRACAGHTGAPMPTFPQQYTPHQQPYSPEQQPFPPNVQHKAERKLDTGEGGGYFDEIKLIASENSVCWIKGIKRKGTGVIGRLKLSNGSVTYVLLTCNHVIPTMDAAKSSFYYFGYTDETKDPSPYDFSILDTTGTWFWSDPVDQSGRMGLNYTMMKVKKDELDKITFVGNNTKMNIEGVQLAGDVFLGAGDNLNIISQIDSRKVAVGNCTEASESSALVRYSISTKRGGAGAPVFKEDSQRLRLVAIHNGAAREDNYGVRLSDILKHQAGNPCSPMPASGSGFKQE